jgi:quercetin dioxygenase-like cupin family protein
MKLINLADIEEKKILPGLHVRFVHSENMTFAYWNIDAGAALPDHKHPHEQVVNIIEGDFELTVAGEPRIIKPGDVVIIPGNVSHSGKAVTNSRVIDVFYPVREDYKS